MAQSTPKRSLSIRDKLCLSSIIKRTGDDDWVLVSNLVKCLTNEDNDESYSAQNCEDEFQAMVDVIAHQKRKRGESELKLFDQVHQKEVSDRISELKRLAEEDRKTLRQMQKSLDAVIATQDEAVIDAEYRQICGGTQDDIELTVETQDTRTRSTDSTSDKAGRQAASSRRRSYRHDDRMEDSPSTPLSVDDSDDVPTGSPSTLQRRGRPPGRTTRRQPGASASDDADSFSEQAASPASIGQSGDKDREYQRWKKSILFLWRTIANHRNANLFLHPVKEDIAPGYSIAVKRPIDLGSIKKAVESGQTRSTEVFIRDVLLMFTNAAMYNNADTEVFAMTREMQDFAIKNIREFQASLVTTDSPQSGQVRERRRNLADDKEDEKRASRRSTMEMSETTKAKRR